MSLLIAKIIADSEGINTGDRITTFILPRFPKVLLQELNTHRVFSRNAASSRAIPVEKMITRVKQDPYCPRFTKAKKGMSGIEDDDSNFQQLCRDEWGFALNDAIHAAGRLVQFGCHKQNANRLLEPFARVPVIVTSTKWDNFFKLRCDKVAHPDFREVAIEMRNCLAGSQPQELKPGQWHIPMFNGEMRGMGLGDQLKVATARCARVSYDNHDGSGFNPKKDLELHDRLLASGHLSPFEHCAQALAWHRQKNSRNFEGWYSYRAQLEDQEVTP